MKFTTFLGIVGGLCLGMTSVVSATDYENMELPQETRQQHDQRMQWWREGKFGMFIHYGLYSGLAGEYKGKKLNDQCAEWIQTYLNIESGEYARATLPLFNPQKGCAQNWVATAKKMGCKYVVLTTKHHEGFALFDSKVSDFNSKKTNDFDIVAEYVQACRDQGIKVGFYHSLLDWQQPDYDAKLLKGLAYPNSNFKTHLAPHHDKYKEYLRAQVQELLTNYGTVDVLWWDFSCPTAEGDRAWNGTSLVRMVRLLQPNIIMNNRLFSPANANNMKEGRLKVPKKGTGDFCTPERYIPKSANDIGDWESCITMNQTWGYSKVNNSWKTSDQVIRELVTTVSRGGNFLLNFGPMPDGSLCPQEQEIASGVGAWMDVNHEAIYGTTKNPFSEKADWGVVTQKGDVLYLCVEKMPKDNVIHLPEWKKVGVKASLLSTGQNIPVSCKDNEVSVDLTGVKLSPSVTVIKLGK